MPVELRYQLDGDAMAGQPVTLHLAAVPRVEGTNLVGEHQGRARPRVPERNVECAEGRGRDGLSQAGAPDAHGGGPQELRVLVTMDFPIGQGFTWYTVPLAGATSSKQAVDRLQ